MQFNEYLKKLQGVKLECLNILNDLMALLDLYSNFKKDPTGSIDAVIDHELTQDHGIFKEEIRLGIQQAFTYDIAYNKGLSELTLMIKEKVDLFKSTLEQFKLSRFLEESQELNTKNLLTLDTKSLFDRKEVINRNVDKVLFAKRTLEFLHSIYRGDLIHGKQCNDLFNNLSVLVKGLFQGITSKESIQEKLAAVKQNTAIVFRNDLNEVDLKDLYNRTLKPLINLRREQIPESDLDSLIKIINHNTSNKKSGIIDSPQEVYLKYSTLINNLTLTSRTLNESLEDIYEVYSVAYQTTFLTIWGTLNRTVDQVLNTLETQEDSNLLVNHLKGYVEIVYDLFSYFVGGIYYIKAEVDIYILIFKIMMQITVLSSLDKKN